LEHKKSQGETETIFKEKDRKYGKKDKNDHGISNKSKNKPVSKGPHENNSTNRNFQTRKSDQKCKKTGGPKTRVGKDR
jgi:hypothetical protein